MKNINKKLIFLIVGCLFVLLLVTVLVLTGKDDETHEHLIEVPGYDPEDWTQEIQIEEVDEDNKRLTNPFEGYRITIPNDWLVRETANRPAGLQILFESREIDDHDHNHNHEEHPAHIADGGRLTIFAFDNDRGLSLPRWISRSEDVQRRYVHNPDFRRVRVASMDAYTTTYQLREDTLDGVAVVENSLVKDFVFENAERERIYIVSCHSADEHFQQLVAQCEEVIESFEVF